MCAWRAQDALGTGQADRTDGTDRPDGTDGTDRTDRTDQTILVKGHSKGYAVKSRNLTPFKVPGLDGVFTNRLVLQ